MPVIYRGSNDTVLQNLLTSDGLNVMGLLNGQPAAITIRAVVDTNSVPGEAVVDVQVLVPGFGWRSTGFAGHTQ